MNNTETPEPQAPGQFADAHVSAKWVVRDLTRRLTDQEFDTKEAAEKWSAHLWEWQPSARPVLISPNNHYAQQNPAG